MKNEIYTREGRCVQKSKSTKLVRKRRHLRRPRGLLNRIPTPPPQSAQRQRLKRLVPPAPQLAFAGGVALDRRDPEMRDGGAEDHARAEDDQDPAVADGGLLAGPGAEVVVRREDLDEDGAELAGAGADAVAGGAVARGEDFGGDDVCGCIGA
ncbi:hypothetical protein CNMCM8812_007887 [Aspergillus fumigatus]|nr:hypothetical protein CNMCM8812_007887 [Aspergillus fumigatus]